MIDFPGAQRAPGPMLLALASAVLAMALHQPGWAQFQSADVTTVTVDWTRTEGVANRGLFSVQGFMQLYAQSRDGGINGLPGLANQKAMESFLKLNPEGTHTRLEILIDRMEPENDNANASAFEWTRLYPQKMIRFIDDREAFERFALGELGMEPLALLAYNARWLKSADKDDQVGDKNEWAEFAAAVVESYNGNQFTPDYAPRLRYCEIWNEPNFPNFHMGTREAYFNLYNHAARRIHAHYPGVMVGGPAVTKSGGDADEWIADFLEECGPQVDFVAYHTYGEPVEQIASDVQKYAAALRRLPGKQTGRIMITETDQWVQGWAKAQYVLERQFRMISLSDLILGIHHFCVLAYNEAGNYTFGVVDQNGGVLGGTYWPYWLFRNYTGSVAYVHATGTQAGRISAAASHASRNGQTLATVVLHNRSGDEHPIRFRLFFEPSPSARALTISRVTESFNGVERALEVAAGLRQMEVELGMEPGEGVSLTLQEPGRRFFGFSDLNAQEGPWVGISSTSDLLNFGDSAQVTLQVLNTSFTPLAGRLVLAGVPDGWTSELLAGETDLADVPFGESRDATYRVTAATLPPHGTAGLVARFEPVGESSLVAAESVAVTVSVVQPIRAIALPQPVQAVPGEANQLDFQLSSQVAQTLGGALRIDPLPGIDFEDAPTSYVLNGKVTRRIALPFRVAPATPPGEYAGAVHVTCLGVDIPTEFRIVVTAAVDGLGRMTALDLSGHANFDAVAFDRNRTEYTPSMGMFVYPADYTPSGRPVRVRGIPFNLLSLEDGLKNVVLPQGQRIAVPSGRYSGVVFLGFGHDGAHPGTWTLHYGDDTSVGIESQIPEWCTPPPEGFEVAMTAPYRYVAGGPAPPACELFHWTLPADAGKTLEAIELPTLTNAYIFAITLVGTQD